MRLFVPVALIFWGMYFFRLKHTTKHKIEILKSPERPNVVNIHVERKILWTDPHPERNAERCAVLVRVERALGNDARS